MKALITFLIFLTSAVYSQWVSQSSGTAETLNDIIFQNTSTGYICGNSGVILKTTNGGENWITMNSGSSSNLSCIIINPGNTNYVIAAGRNAALLLSTNAGLSFTNVPVSPVDWKRVRHADIFNVYAVGTQGRVIKSTNAGSTWSIIPVPGIDTLSALAVFDASTVLVGGEEGRIFKTTNSGANWIQVTSNIPNTAMVNDFFFAGNTTGYAVTSRGEIAKTVNGGLNWFTSTQISSSVNIRSLFVIGNIAYASIKNGSNGGIIKSFNGASGVEWHFLQAVFPGGAPAIFFTSSLTGYGAGGLGFISKTTNGGGDPIGIEPLSGIVAGKFSLSQNYPNPFNPQTNIEFSIPSASFVRLAVYDVLGKEVEVLVNGNIPAGTYKTDFNAGSLNSGVYFYKIQAGSYSETKRMILVK